MGAVEGEPIGKGSDVDVAVVRQAASKRRMDADKSADCLARGHMRESEGAQADGLPRSL